jgi:mediator of RNA polymerase II transcription subunit 12, fungi type
VTSEIVPQFVNNGLRCITEILDVPMIAEANNLAECTQRAGEILRVLAHLAQPLRAEHSLLPSLESVIQDQFFNVIFSRFSELESILSAGPSNASTQPEVTQAVIFLGRLLQFDLGFRGAWTTTAKAISCELSSTILKLTMVRHLILMSISPH